MFVWLNNIFKVPKKREPVPVPVTLPREEEVTFEEEISPEEVLPEEEEILPEEEEEEVLPEEELLPEQEEFPPEEEEFPPEEEEFVPEEVLVPEEEEVLPEIKPKVPVPARGIASLLGIIKASFVLNSAFLSFCSFPVLSIMLYSVLSTI